MSRPSTPDRFGKGVRALMIVASLSGMAAKTDSCTWNVSSTGNLDRTQETDCLASDGGMFDCTATPPAATAPATTATTTTTAPDAGTTAAVALTVDVTPVLISLGPSMSRQFTAVVTGTSDVAVVWQIVGTPLTAVTLTQSGLFTAPASVTAETVTIQAVSLADTTKVGQAVIKLLSSEAMTITPSAAHLNPDGALPFTGQDTGGYTVAYSVDEPGGGTIDPVTGDYVAPPYVGVYHVRATSAHTPDLYARAKVTVQSGALPKVTISPTSAILTEYVSSTVPGDSLGFTATVANDSVTGVTWKLDPGGCTTSLTNTAGVVSSVGTGTCTDAKLTATSVDDPSESATAAISVAQADSKVFTLSGTAALGTGLTATGPVYITVGGDYTGTVMLPSLTTTGTNYVVRALSSGRSCTGSGSVSVVAWVDVEGTHSLLPAVDPAEYLQTVSYTCSTPSATQALTLTMQNPTNPAAPSSPVATGLDTALMVNWKGDSQTIGTGSDSYERADHYTIYVKKAPSASSTCDVNLVGPSLTTNDKVLTVPAGLGGFGFVSGLTNGNYYCVAIVARAGSFASAVTYLSAPVAPGVPSGSQTNNAEIDVNYGALLSHLSTNPQPVLYTGLQGNDGVLRLSRNVAANQSATVFLNNLPNLGYQAFSRIDANGDGWIGPDEPQFFTTWPPTIDVASASPPPVAVTMLDAERLVGAHTMLYDSSGSTHYRLLFFASANRKALAAARVDSIAGGTPPLVSPVDLAFRPPQGPGPQYTAELDLGASAPSTSSTLHFLLTNLDGTVGEATVNGLVRLSGLPSGLAVTTGAYSSRYLSPVNSSGVGVTTHTGTGTGTITTSVDTGTPTATGYCIKITTAGTAGDGISQYEWVADATCPNTGWSAATNTPTNATATAFDSTNNPLVKITFDTGTLVFGDTYTFRATPGITIHDDATFSWSPPDTNTYSYSVQVQPTTGNGGVTLVTNNLTVAMTQIAAAQRLAAGDYSATVTAYDELGNGAVSAALAVSVPVAQ